MSDHRMEAVQAAIDRRGFSALQIRVGVICAAVLALDGYDIVSMGFAIPSLAEAWSLRPAQLTLPLVVGNVGMLVGALVSGPVGDRIGRKPVFVANVLTFAVFSLLSAVSTDIAMLTAMRFLTGLGLGGGVPTAIALTSDYSPQKHQAKLVSIMTLGVQTGVITGGIIVSRLIPVYGWQSVFVFGGVLPLLLVPVLVLALPESLQLTVARGRSSGAARKLFAGVGLHGALVSDGAVLTKKNPVLELFRNGFAVVTILLWLMFAANFLATYLVSLWMPTILHSAGFTTGQAVLATTMFSAGGMALGLVLGWPIARYGAERVLSLSLLAGAVLVLIIPYSLWSYPLVLLAIFGAGAGISGSQAGMNALSGAAYPALIRSSGSGWALGIGRLGNILGPLLGGVLLGFGYPSWMIFMFAGVAVAVGCLSMFTLGAVRSGRPALVHE